MNFKEIYKDSGLLALPLRLVIGWTYFSAFWRRTVLADKLDPELAGYIGNKFNAFLPNALGIKPVIRYLLENPELLRINMIAFTVVEGIVGLFIMLGLFTRIMSIGVLSLAMGILLSAGWIGTTCLDEWQIGALGVATGFVLFLTGSGKYSADHYLINKKVAFTRKKWFDWFGSGILPVKEHVFSKIVLIGSLSILGITLMTNQVFHGGLWGTLHNKSVKPKIEISEGKIENNTITFDIFRTEGVDVYGSWVIDIRLLNSKKNTVLAYTQKELATLTEQNITNYYVAKVKPGKHSLVVPLGSKANIQLTESSLSNLPKGLYSLVITDISGLNWNYEIEKK